MKSEVTLDEAQRQLGSLLAEAVPGEMFFISQNGAKLATVTKLPLTPPRPTSPDGEPSLVALARSIRSRVKPGPETVKELINQGRP